MYYSKNVTGTNAYWNQVEEQLKATITQVGPPTVYWTLSCDEFHSVSVLFNESDNLSNSVTRRQNILNYPRILHCFFNFEN